MDTGKRQHLQDIYSSDRITRDDFTPQVSAEVIEEKKRDIRRHQFTNFALGMLVLILAVSLILIIVFKGFRINFKSPSKSTSSIMREYIPRHSLPAESQWALDFSRSYSDPTWDGTGERPFNAMWIKKAAFNIILAEQAANLEKFAEATEYYEQALEILPDLEGVRIPLGMAYFRLGSFDKALKLLENVPEADLTFDILNNLGAACINAEAYDRAEQYLKRSLELNPAYTDALKNLATLYTKQDSPNEAIAAYEQYLDLRPTDTDTRYNFSLYLTKIGNWELAAEQLHILTRDITDVANLYLLLARVENKLGHPDKALEALRRGVQLTDPKLALAWMDDSDFEQLRNTEDFQALIKYAKKKR